MDPKQQALRNKQKERQQRGHNFQEEIRKSWLLVPNVWQLRIKDGGGGTRPADMLTICDEVNILAELKRTASQKFELSFLRSGQVKGLVDFDEVIGRNYGLVFVSFLNEAKDIDEAYAFRLVAALRYMHRRSRAHITLEELRQGAIHRINLPLLESAERKYDLRRAADCYKYL